MASHAEGLRLLSEVLVHLGGEAPAAQGEGEVSFKPGRNYWRDYPAACNRPSPPPLCGPPWPPDWRTKLARAERAARYAAQAAEEAARQAEWDENHQKEVQSAINELLWQCRHAIRHRKGNSA